MLITPLPGTRQDAVRSALDNVRHKAETLQSPGPETAFSRLIRYLAWATDAADHLRHYIRSKDIEHLVLTPRYQMLVSAFGTLAGSAQERVVNGLLNLEVSERLQAFDNALDEFTTLIQRWDQQERFVVADSSFYIQSPIRLADIDLHAILGIRPDAHLRLLFPITVVDELDGLKESGKHRSRWRASHTLGQLDEVLDGKTHSIKRRADLSGEPAQWVGQIAWEIVLDQPGHTRLPIADDEIIDRAVAIQALAGREVRLLTCDTGQHTRGRAAGLQVTKVPAKDPGPEPDWETQDRPGNGTRAKRRERQAEQEASTPEEK